MGVAQLQTEALSQLRSQDQLNFLDSIDQLRSEGLGRYASLPQIIVCGDQSSGKSSVLEAISGVSFPVQSKTCTRFPTELVLRRTPQVSSKVSIVPDPDTSRSPEERVSLEKISRNLEGYDGLSEMIKAAKDAMGIKECGKTFSRDLLRVEITGPDRSHLTIVDLPGLIHSSTNPQADDDVGLVTDVVRKYMEQPRSVILAVISAKNDLENQIVMKMRREVDPTGQRTMGIITKPDTLHVGSETEEFFASLAQNKTVELRHGWHVLKNLDSENASFNMAKRDIEEEKFFSSSIWSSLPRHLLGISNLRPRLSNVLTKQIVSELPSLVKEISSKLEDCRNNLIIMGPRREKRDEQQRYIVGVSVKFQLLVNRAIDGDYSDAFFEDAQSDHGYSQRLRAVVQNSNQQFAKDLSDHGHLRYHVDFLDDDYVKEQSGAERVPVNRDRFITHVMNMMFRTRGRELPGTFSPMIVEDLFKEQSRPWKKILNAHIQKVAAAARKFLGLVCEHVADETIRQYILLDVIEPALETIMKALQLKADELLEPHKYWHPITYNHYFTETIQKVRDERRMAQVRKALASGLGIPEGDTKSTARMVNKSVNVSALVQALTIRDEPDMDRFAASEALDCMEAYYKVALKRFVDDVAVELVEAKLLKALLDIFSPTTVYSMPPDLVDRIASESGESLRRREQLEKQLDVLSKSSEVCKRFASMKIIGKIVDRASAPASAGELISEEDEVASVDRHSSEADSPGFKGTILKLLSMA